MKVKGLDTTSCTTYTEEEPNALTPEEVRPSAACWLKTGIRSTSRQGFGFATGWRPIDDACL